MVATSNPITGGGTQSAGNAVTSAQGRAYTPNWIDDPSEGLVPLTENPTA